MKRVESRSDTVAGECHSLEPCHLAFPFVAIDYRPALVEFKWNGSQFGPRGTSKKPRQNLVHAFSRLRRRRPAVLYGWPVIPDHSNNDRINTAGCRPRPSLSSET